MSIGNISSNLLFWDYNYRTASEARLLYTWMNTNRLSLNRDLDIYKDLYIWLLRVRYRWNIVYSYPLDLDPSLSDAAFYTASVIWYPQLRWLIWDILEYKLNGKSSVEIPPRDITPLEFWFYFQIQRLVKIPPETLEALDITREALSAEKLIKEEAKKITERKNWYIKKYWKWQDKINLYFSNHYKWT